MLNTSFACQILMKLEISRQILETCQYIKFYEIRPLRAEIFHAQGQSHRQKDGQT